MDEEQATAVRPLKKTKQDEIQKFRMVRLQTGVQNRANSEAFSPDGTDKVSRRKRFHTVLNKTVSSPPAKGEIPAFAWVIVHRPVCNLIANSICIF